MNEPYIEFNQSNMIEVFLKCDFSIIRETLTRIGIAAKQKKIIFQSCHILHKKKRYYIVHFKELFALDGKATNITESDLARRNKIISLLAEWDLIEVSDKGLTAIENQLPINQLMVLPYSEKGEWKLESKYSIGNN